MIQAYCGERNEKLLIGVTRENITRLTDGKPMRVILPEHITVREVFVLFGEDKPEILKQLEDAGLEIADAMKASATADPL